MNTFKIVFILLGIVAILSMIYPLLTGFERQITIAKKYTQVIGGRYASTAYMVVDSSNTIYMVTNLWWKADFNDAEDWNRLDVGKTYRVKGWGYRVPWLGLYPCINEIVA